MTDYLDARVDWDVVAWYDELPLWSAPFGLLLLEHLPIKAGRRILDVGCGTGFPLIELAQRMGRSCQVYGVDPWRPALRRAAQRARELHIQNVQIVEADAARLPFADRSFDTIVSNLGINNFADPAGTMSQCARVLRPGGVLALTTNLCGHMALFYEVFEKVLCSLGHDQCLPLLHEHIDHRMTIDKVTRLLTSAGLEPRRTHSAGFRMRFCDGTALLRHAFVRLAFLDGWRAIIPPPRQPQVFAALEDQLNIVSISAGGLELEIPMAYTEAVKSGP